MIQIADPTHCRSADWLDAYLNEVTTFPGSKYDDQADSTAQALACINSVPAEPGWVTYARYESARFMIANGTPLEAAAAKNDLTPEEIKKWISEREERKAAMRKRLEPEFD